MKIPRGHILLWKLLLTFYMCKASLPPIDLSTCGQDKSCFREPSSCSGSDCQSIATWTSDDTHVSFEISSKTSGWVSLGFSGSPNMKSTSVHDCIRRSTDGRIHVGYSYNSGFSNTVLTATDLVRGISDISTSYVDGVLQCRFKRQLQVTGAAEPNLIFNLNNDYFLLLGYGNTNGDVKRKHEVTPVTSNIAVDLQELTKVGTVVKDTLSIRAHGSLMIIGWTVLAALGITMARYYKDMWPKSGCYDVKPWFWIHRPFMFTLSCITIAGFIVIFVHVGGWSTIVGDDILKAHPYLGVIIAALSLTNPIMAFFRPHPGTRNRFIFNWAHWCVGITAFLLAIVTIFIGLELAIRRNLAPDGIIWIMVVVVVGIAVAWIVLEINKCVYRYEKGSDNFDLSATGHMERRQRRPGRNIRNIVIALLVILVLGGAIAMVVLLAIH